MKKLQLLFAVFLTMCSTAIFAQTIDKQNAAVSFFWVDLNEGLGVMKNKSLYDSIYSCVTSAVIHNAEYSFKPVGSLKDKVAYNVLGYPMGSGKKAAKSGVANTYVKFMIQIAPVGIFTGGQKTVSVGGVGVGQHKTKAKIKVKIDATVYDANGEKVKEVSEFAESAEEIEIIQDLVVIGSVTQRTFEQEIGKDAGFTGLIKDAALKIANALK